MCIRDRFHAVNAAFSNPQIVAEDLGCEEEGLVQFLLEAGYPGMKAVSYTQLLYAERTDLWI